MNLTSLTVLNTYYIRVSDVDGRYASYYYGGQANVAEIALGHASEYNARQLRVQRTRQRVILRILHELRQYLTIAAIDAHGVTDEAAYIDRTFLLNSGGVINWNGERYITGKPTSAHLVAEITSALTRVRRFGARGTRRLAMRESKPMKFKRLWKNSYHERDMGAYPSDCSFDDEMDGIKMGVELEFARVDDGIEGDDAYLYMASDGSLPAEGAEFITRPDSWRVHVKELGDFLSINRGKLGISNRCGMHVHVDRSSLSTDAIDLIVKRIYGTDFPNARPFREARHKRYERIAGRAQNTFWSLRDNDPGSHFEAVNRSNRRTIEFRMFSGTSKIAKIKRRLQWVATICAWAHRKARGQVAAMVAPTLATSRPWEGPQYSTYSEIPPGHLPPQYPGGECCCARCVREWARNNPALATFSPICALY